jgi:hypothetical protein
MPHSEQLQLICGTDIIYVPLEAVLPASKLQLPAALDFGCVPFKEPAVQQLPMKNVGDAPLHYSWKVEDPFAVLPADGQLHPGQTVLCQVRHEPTQLIMTQFHSSEEDDSLDICVLLLAKFRAVYQVSCCSSVALAVYCCSPSLQSAACQGMLLDKVRIRHAWSIFTW